MISSGCRTTALLNPYVQLEWLIGEPFLAIIEKLEGGYKDILSNVFFELYQTTD